MTMRRRDFIVGLGGAVVMPLAAHAQQSAGTKMARVGWLTAQRAHSLTPFIEALRAGFADLGYVEGRNLTLVFRYGDDQVDRVPELAAQLVQIPVDVILAQGAAVSVLNKLDLSLPVVFA